MMSAVVQVFGCRHDEAIHTAAAGVRKAPRHEIAGSGAPAVLRGYGDLAAGK